MTKFQINEFTYHGKYLNYTGDFNGAKVYAEPCHPTRLGKRQPSFVARFKHGGMNDFRNFLVKNFTCEEYFKLADAGMSPLTILETKGYIDPKTKSLLVDNGFEPTLEGRTEYINGQIEAHSMRMRLERAFSQQELKVLTRAI
jgi:hypothetical protein